MQIRKPKTLIYDIETAYNLAGVWGTNKQIVHASQILRPYKVICIAYRFMHWPKSKVEVLHWEPKERDNRLSYPYSDEKMLRKFYEVAQEADVIVGHNGDAFDAKTLNARMIYYDIGTLTHLLSEDTLKQSRSTMRLPSHRLDFLCKYFNLKGKLSNPNNLWEEVAFSSDEKIAKKALNQMVKYCKNDVKILELLYKRIFPYVKHKINLGTFNDKPHICPQCGSSNLIKRGMNYTMVGKYQSYQCKDCGRRCQDSKRLNTVKSKEILR